MNKLFWSAALCAALGLMGCDTGENATTGDGDTGGAVQDTTPEGVDQTEATPQGENTTGTTSPDTSSPDTGSSQPADGGVPTAKEDPDVEEVETNNQNE